VKKALNISFIYNFLEFMRSNIAQGTKGSIMIIFRTLFMIIKPMFYILTVEADEHHVFLKRSVKYSVSRSRNTASKVSLTDEVSVARETISKVETEVYSVDMQEESADAQMKKLLIQF